MEIITGAMAISIMVGGVPILVIGTEAWVMTGHGVTVAGAIWPDGGVCLTIPNRNTMTTETTSPIKTTMSIMVLNQLNQPRHITTRPKPLLNRLRHLSPLR